MTKSLHRLIRIGWMLAWLGGPAVAVEFYVAPNGVSNAPGTRSQPLDLASAVAATSRVRPGDTVWLRGGLYRGAFASGLTGAPGLPITVRGVPGERPILDGVGRNPAATLVINGAWTHYRDFEVMNSQTDRTLDAVRPDGIDVFGPNTKLINLVVHDTGNGIGFWSPATNAEIYGCIIYNVGWQESDPPNGQGGTGHSIYAQNDSGTKRIHDTIACNSFGFGLHAYAESGMIRGFDLQGNIFFNAGAANAKARARDNLLVSGATPASRITVVSNYTYMSLSNKPGNVRLYYRHTGNQGLVCQHNYFAGGGTTVSMTYWNKANFSSNTLYGEEQVLLAGPFANLGPESVFDYNTYYSFDTLPFRTASPPNKYHNLASWRKYSRREAHSTMIASLPPPQVFVRPNQYQPKRAHVAVYNWTLAGSVAVDLQSVLAPGDRYEIRNVQNFLGPPVRIGTFTGAQIELPMTNLVAARPLASPYPPIPPTQQFNAFVVLGQPALNEPPSISPIPDQSLIEGLATDPIQFTVRDDDTDLATLSLSATSSNPSLISPARIQFDGTGSSRTVTLAPEPGQLGFAVIEISVNDGTTTVSESFSVTVKPMNHAPQVNAGPDRIVTVGEMLALNGAVTDDGQPAPSQLTVQWRRMNGGGEVTFEDASAARTSAHFSTAGTHFLSLNASDGELTGIDILRVEVRPREANQPPRITGVDVENITESRADIAWQTDRPADSQVVFRAEADGGERIVLNSAAVTTHRVALADLKPSTFYRFSVRSREASGPAAVVEGGQFSTPPTGVTARIYQPIEAEGGTVTSSVEIAYRLDGSEGLYVRSGADSGSVAINFQVPEPGSYVVWARVLAERPGENAWLVSVDRGPETVFDLEVGDELNTWHWRRVPANGGDVLPAGARHMIKLTAGAHQLTFRARVPGVSLDRLLVTNDTDFTPDLPRFFPDDLDGLTLFDTVIRRTVGPGYSLVANPLAHGDNTLADVLPTLSADATLYCVDPATQVFTANPFRAGTWTNPDQKLEPGTGAAILNPSPAPLTLTFRGQPRPVDARRTFAPGLHLIGAQVPRAGLLRHVLDLDISDGTQLHQLNPLSSTYTVRVWMDGRWANESWLRTAEGVFLEVY